MTTPYRKILPTILFTAALHYAPAGAAELTPRQAAELYCRAWYNYDSVSVQSPQYSRADEKKPDYLDPERAAHPVDWVVEHWMGNPPPDATREQLLLYAQYLVARTKFVHCHATRSSLEKSKANGSYFARVTVDCAVPNAVPALRQIAQEFGWSTTGGALPPPAVIDAMRKAYANAPLSRHVANTILMTRKPDGHTWTVSGPFIDNVDEDLWTQLRDGGLVKRVETKGWIE
jgi:hypothetical protein